MRGEWTQEAQKREQGKKGKGGAFPTLLPFSHAPLLPFPFFPFSLFFSSPPVHRPSTSSAPRCRASRRHPRLPWVGRESPRSRSTARSPRRRAASTDSPRCARVVAGRVRVVAAR